MLSRPVLCAFLLALAAPCGAAQRLLPSVEVEEGIYTTEPANNGAGPLWCYGTTSIVRIGKDVFASGIETLKDQKPLNNVRWMLFRRTERGWDRQQADPQGRTREPCPLGAFPDGRIFLSVNPTLTQPGTYNGPAKPQVLEFSAANPRAPFKALQPVWEGAPAFTEHSYRGFCADGPSRELLLFNILLHEAQYWSFRDRDGNWSKCGKFEFPMGTDYEKPEPIRLCYPVSALSRRAAHLMAISDIIEPVKAWREYKLVLHNGQTWDYDFRRLFYTWTPDITRVPFAPAIEVASREKTAGHITNLDIWVDKAGRAHLLWLEQSVADPRMRDKFFPDVKITQSLEYGIVDRGKVVLKRALAIGGEGASKETPGYARFQATPDGRLLVFYYCSGADDKGRAVNENRVMEVFPDGTHSDPVRVPLEHPFTSFQTATERGGSAPSYTLDVLGDAQGRPGISYARINLANQILADFEATVSRGAAGPRVQLDAGRAVSAAGKILSWRWSVGGAPASGVTADRSLPRGGSVAVELTVRDDHGNVGRCSRTLRLPPAPADLGLGQWGWVLRAEAESFVREGGGGPIHVRNDKLGASGLSLSHWNSRGHWLEWEVELPQEDDYLLLARYATPENATRVLTLDGKPCPPGAFPSTGGYGTESVDNWGLVALTDASGKPAVLHLSPGKHTLRLENGDGTGLNLDYLEWVARRTPAPGPGAKGTGGRVVDESGYRFVLPLRGSVFPGQINAGNGHCYTVPLGPNYVGDGVKDVPPSTLRLFEDGKELGPAHAAHVDIRKEGAGRFSHWNTLLYFSASDNSDPRANGRRYTWELSR